MMLVWISGYFAGMSLVEFKHGRNGAGFVMIAIAGMLGWIGVVV